MGAWGIGPFQNDSGADEVSRYIDVIESGGASKLDEYLRQVLPLDEGYVEADEGAEALAIAALLAGHSGNDAGAVKLLEAEQRWLAAQPAEAVAQWRELARAAVLRVLADDSELAELWDESEAAEEWRANTQKLAEALA